MRFMPALYTRRLFALGAVGAPAASLNAEVAFAANAGDYVTEPAKRIPVRAHVDVVSAAGARGNRRGHRRRQERAKTLLLEKPRQSWWCRQQCHHEPAGSFSRSGEDDHRRHTDGSLAATGHAEGSDHAPACGLDRETNNRPDTGLRSTPRSSNRSDRMTAEAGVKVLFNARVVGAIVNGDRAEGVYIEVVWPRSRAGWKS